MREVELAEPFTGSSVFESEHVIVSYRPLSLSPETPTPVERFIRGHVDMQFHDVHCMLRLPMKEAGLEAGCNLSAASFLLALIAGLSTVVYAGEGGAGYRFRTMLEKYYPWTHEPAGELTPAQISRELYELFRNPLVHALGLETQVHGRSDALRTLRRRRPERFVLQIGRNDGLTEAEVEELERSDGRPAFAAWTILAESNRRVLWVEGLYWGTRKLVQLLTEDKDVTARAETFLLGR